MPPIQGMRRHGNLYPRICDPENLALAFRRARKGKATMRGVLNFEKDVEGNLAHIRQILLDKTFHTSTYQRKTVYEPKERTIYVLPFSPDRIVGIFKLNCDALRRAGLLIFAGLHLEGYKQDFDVQDIINTNFFAFQRAAMFGKV